MAAKLSDDALAALFHDARTPNGFTDEPVSDDELHALWDLLKMGPTSANQLPARFVWVRSADAKEKLASLATGTNGDRIREAPVSVVVGMDLEFHEHLPELFPHADAKAWFGDPAGRRVSAFRNSSLQGGYMILAARALGLAIGAMSGFDADGVRAAFFADQPAVEPNFIATLGHGDPAKLFARSPRPPFERFNRIV